MNVRRLTLPALLVAAAMSGTVVPAHATVSLEQAQATSDQVKAYKAAKARAEAASAAAKHQSTAPAKPAPVKH